MLTFVGEGYNPAFRANYRQIAKRLSAGEDILLVSGPDDICAPLVGCNDSHCHGAGVEMRDATAAEAVGLLLKQEISPGLSIRPDATLVERLRMAFAAGDIRSACHGCEWESLCSRVAGHSFRGVLVVPP
jgi:hypothetical protein